MDTYLNTAITWWIPLPDAIDLPDKHKQRLTSFVHPTNAVPDGSDLPEDQENTIQIDHEYTLTIHQRTIDSPVIEPTQALLFTTASGPEATEREGSGPNATQYFSIVQATISLDLQTSPDEQILSEIFDYLLDKVRQLQEAVALVSQNLTNDWVARERLPIHIPMTITTARRPENKEGGVVEMFVVNPDSLRLFDPPAPLSEPKLDTLTQYLERDDQAVSFSAYHRLRYETRVMFHRRGDYRMTIVSAAIAAESLFTELLLHLLWDEGLRPEQVAPLFNPDSSSTSKRVKNEFHRHLGGTWDPKQKGPISDWRNLIAEPRNQIVHSGRMAGFDEAQDAVRTLANLESFLSKRLLDKIRLRPRTAMAYLGTQRIQSERKMTRQLQKLYSSQDEPQWVPTFRRWRDVVEMEIEQARGKRITPTPNESVLLAIPRGDKIKFVLFDESIQMAVPVSGIPKHIRDQYERGISNFGSHDDAQGEVFRLVLDDPSIKEGLQVRGDWVYAYHLVPTVGVMSNGRDLYGSLTSKN